MGKGTLRMKAMEHCGLILSKVPLKTQPSTASSAVDSRIGDSASTSRTCSQPRGKGKCVMIHHTTERESFLGTRGGEGA